MYSMQTEKQLIELQQTSLCQVSESPIYKKKVLALVQEVRTTETCPYDHSQDQLSLNAGQKYCRMLRMEHSAILSTFIKLPFVIKIFVLSSFEWPFYTGFSVSILTCASFNITVIMHPCVRIFRIG